MYSVCFINSWSPLHNSGLCPLNFSLMQIMFSAFEMLSRSAKYQNHIEQYLFRITWTALNNPVDHWHHLCLLLLIIINSTVCLPSILSKKLYTTEALLSRRRSSLLYCDSRLLSIGVSLICTKKQISQISQLFCGILFMLIKLGKSIR